MTKIHLSTIPSGLGFLLLAAVLEVLITTSPPNLLQRGAHNAAQSFAGFECVGSENCGRATCTPTHSKSRNEWGTRLNTE